MKTLSLILSIYFLLLACIPCSDVQDVHAANLQTITSTVNHLPKPAHKDACTPFCTCSCCQVDTHSPDNGIALSEPPSVKSRYSSIYTFHVKEVLIPFWQPPKIQG